MSLNRLELAARDLGLAVERFALALAADLTKQIPPPVAPVIVQPLAEPRFLTVRDAARRVDRHPDTVRKALDAGHLHGTQQRPGGKWTVEPACVDAWATHQKCAHQKAV